MDERTLRRYGPPVPIVLILVGIAAWREALTPGIVLFLATTLTWMTIRARYTADPLPVSSRYGKTREKLSLPLVAAGMSYLPAIAIAMPLLDFARYSAPVWVLGLGLSLSLIGLWLFWRSHADLGRSWSVTLELRETHALVTSGVYKRIRHPMYAAIFLIAAAQLAVLGNWVAGPAGLLAFTLLYLDRTGPEEAMMAQRFGADWDRYAASTGPLLPTGTKGAV